MSERPPSILSRLWALLIGPLYLAYLAAIGWATTGMAAWLSTLWVLGGAITIMAVLVVFGLKADRYRGTEWRFSLGTIFLVMVPLSIYLAAIRRVLDTDWRGELRDPIVWTGIAVLSFLFMLVTTIILLWLAEALMWLAALLLRTYRRRLGRRRTNDGRTSRAPGNWDRPRSS